MHCNNKSTCFDCFVEGCVCPAPVGGGGNIPITNCRYGHHHIVAILKEGEVLNSIVVPRVSLYLKEVDDACTCQPEDEEVEQQVCYKLIAVIE